MSGLSVLPILTAALVAQPAASAPQTAPSEPLAVMTYDLEAAVAPSGLCARDKKLDPAFFQKLSEQLLSKYPFYKGLPIHQQDFALHALSIALQQSLFGQNIESLGDLIGQGDSLFFFPRSWVHASACMSSSRGNPSDKYMIPLPAGSSVKEILISASKYQPTQVGQVAEFAPEGTFTLVLADASVLKPNVPNFGFTSCPGRSFTVTDATIIGTPQAPQLQISGTLVGETAEIPQELTLYYFNSPIAFYSTAKAKVAQAEVPAEPRAAAPQMEISGVTANTTNIPQDGFVTLTINGTNLSNLSADVSIGDRKLTASPSATNINKGKTKATFKVRIPSDADLGPTQLIVTPFQNNTRKDDLTISITISEKVVVVTQPRAASAPSSAARDRCDGVEDDDIRAAMGCP